MKTFFALVCVFAVILMYFFPLAYLKYSRAEDAEFSELRFAQAVDYAGEAAMLTSMETDNIATDYADETQIRLSPVNAADAFASLILLNYGMPPSERNIEYVKTRISVMVLAETDGYFLAEQRDSGNGEVELIFSVKRPYTIDTNPETPNAGTLYSVNLGLTRWSAVNKATLTVTEGTNYSSVPYSKEQILQWVNRDINLAVNAALERNALKFNKSEYQRFYLPLSPGTVGIQRVERPTLITVIHGLSVGSAEMSSVNGVSVSSRRMVVGWTDGGKKWYAYADEAGDTDGELFISPEEAARAGYYPKLP